MVSREIIVSGNRLVLLAAWAWVAGPLWAGEPLPARWESRGAGGGGALFSPIFSPHAPDELFVSCDMSELFHSRDMGASWSLVDSRSLQGNRATLVQFTSDTNLLYAIDCSSVSGVDAQRPSRSLDGGRTWAPLAVDPTGMGCYFLAADPQRTNRLLVSDYTTLFVTTNGGASFASVYASGGGLFMSGAFFDGSNVWAGCSDGLLVSGDGGRTFALSVATGIPAAEEIVSLAGARESGTVRLYAVTVPDGFLYPGILLEDTYYESPPAYRGVYSLDTGAGSWLARTNGVAAGHRPLFVGLCRTNIAVAWLGGQTDDDYPAVYRTVDGGSNWQNVIVVDGTQNLATGWCGHQGDRDYTYDAYYVGFAVCPVDARRAALTGYGFVHATTNGGQTWFAAYTSPADRNPAGGPTPRGKVYRSAGLENTTCWGVSWSSPSNLFASFSDIRGLRSVDAGSSWGFTFTGNTYNTTYDVVAHSNGLLYAAVSSVHDLYQSTYLEDARIDGGSGEILYSTNHGQVWQRLHNTTNVAFSLAPDPGHTSRLYVAVSHGTRGGFRVTSNLHLGAASTWRALAAPPRTEGHPHQLRVLQDGTLVCTYSGRRAGGAFTASSGLFVSTNGGAGWLDRSHTNMVYWTKDVVVDPYDPGQSTWYVGVFSGWGGAPNGKGGLYRTTNRGLAWTRISALDRVTSCTFSPLDSNVLFMTTETDGLWYSTNARASAPTFSAATNYPFRQPERVCFDPFRPRDMWVTSFGHGLRLGHVAPAVPVLSHDAPEGVVTGVVVRWVADAATSYAVWRAPHPAAAYSPLATGLTASVYTDAASAESASYRITAE